MAKKNIETTRHKDKRVNIPTNELRNFVQEDERSPSVMRYPRDPSLDPQLVWNGKDEQDGEDLAVPVVPIYIQEKIHPQAVIEEVRRQAKADAPYPQQISLFDDFNGIDFEELIDFYEHEQNWSNRMILGDSLQVMASLSEKEGLKGKVQMIYLDPPYGIKFGSNWQVSTRKRSIKDGRDSDLTRQPEQIRAFRDTWKKGIHSYLSYLRDRLVVARELLNNSGSVFVQIGDDNVHLIRGLMDEVFGSDNFCAIITISKTTGHSTDLLAKVTDFLIWYAKDKEQVKYRQLFKEKGLSEGNASSYRYVKLKNGHERSLSRRERETFSKPDGGRIYAAGSLISDGGTNSETEFYFRGETYNCGAGKHWKTHLEGMNRLGKADRIHVARNSIRYIRFLKDFPITPYTNIWEDTGTGNFTENKIYVVQTAQKIIERCLLMTTDPGDLVLDPTMGSGTTAYVAEEWGRRWITIDTSRVAVALARTRLMSARYPYYVLSDSPEGLELEEEITGHRPADRSTGNDIRKGFVYHRAPHIMLRDIANDEEIDEIYARWQKQIEPLRHEINELLGTDWKEWEVPREVKDEWEPDVKDLLNTCWKKRQQRQAEIDRSIERVSDYEILYDQPYEDKQKVRVTGAFTVESLSPHRFISDEDALRRKDDPAAVSDFEETILENLKASGVQNTIKDERLTFESIESYSSEWIHAVGNYTDSDGQARRAAIFIGSEHGTVSPQQIQEAAKEAVKGIGFDVLVVCGFAFDPHVSTEARSYGNLQVLITRMNPDLAMSSDLKTTQTGNLFMVFGEPDINIHDAGNDQIEVEIKGVDIYDPTTGEIRKNSTDDIACWFIDTDYDEESFFVRHAYFTGADEPYDQLKRTLRSEIDEEAWNMLYQTTSMPFEVPERGKIAIKVINHYGDEVLKVYEV